jgi:predicted MFS family arabinose efflux permease
MVRITAGADAGISTREMIGRVIVATICRMLLNTSRRFVYPFAPVLSRGLGVPLTAITSMIAVNQATGVMGILVGPLADRFGYRLMMMIGMAMLVIAMFAAGILPYYAVILAALFVAGLGKNMFDPAVQAYAGERISFARRGLVIGVLEISWAGSFLLGIPLMGFLIDRFGWRSPFFALAALGLVGMISLYIVLGVKTQIRTRRSSGQSVWIAWRQISKEKAALGALACSFFIGIANDNLFVIYGVWLEQSFHLSVIALGLGTGLIGVAELFGEFLTAALADRMGLKRAVIGGLLLSGLSYLSLPLLDRSLTQALGGLFVLFLVFEFSVVAFVSLCTELMPQWRATMMSTFLAAAGIGRMVGALIGGPVWLAWGIWGTAVASAVISGLGLAVLFWGLRGWRPQ